MPIIDVFTAFRMASVLQMCNFCNEWDFTSYLLKWEATALSFSKFLLTKTRFIPRFANSVAYARPIPSVEPVTTEKTRWTSKLFKSCYIFKTLLIFFWFFDFALDRSASKIIYSPLYNYYLSDARRVSESIAELIFKGNIQCFNDRNRGVSCLCLKSSLNSSRAVVL